MPPRDMCIASCKLLYTPEHVVSLPPLCYPLSRRGVQPAISPSTSTMDGLVSLPKILADEFRCLPSRPGSHGPDAYHEASKARASQVEYMQLSEALQLIRRAHNHGLKSSKGAFNHLWFELFPYCSSTKNLVYDHICGEPLCSGAQPEENRLLAIICAPERIKGLCDKALEA